MNVCPLNNSRALCSIFLLFPLAAAAYPAMEVPAYSFVDELVCQLDGRKVGLGTPVEEKLSGTQVCGTLDGVVLLRREYKAGVKVGTEVEIGAVSGTKTEYVFDGDGKPAGVVRRYHANGRLAAEEHYRDNVRYGESRYYAEDGRLTSVQLYQGEFDAVAAVSWLDNGKLYSVRCGTRSLVPEDKKSCGFDGRTSTVELYTSIGKVAEENYLEGRLIGRAGFDENGRKRYEDRLTDDRRTLTVFRPDGAGSEVIEFDIDAQPIEGPIIIDGYGENLPALLKSATYVSKMFNEEGVLLEEQIVRAGRRQRAAMWYMNGKMRTQTQYRDGPRGIIWQIESFRDDGSLLSRTQLNEGFDMVGVQQHFDQSGKLEREEVYSDSGVKTAERAYDADGRVIREIAFYADGSRKQPPDQP